MMDREKVIKGLETIKQFFGYGLPSTAEMFDSYYGILNDALALLKEQEPRVLGWDEIRNYPVVYGEFRGIKDIYPLIITVDNLGRCLSWNPGINVTK